MGFYLIRLTLNYVNMFFVVFFLEESPAAPGDKVDDHYLSNPHPAKNYNIPLYGKMYMQYKWLKVQFATPK